MVLKQSVHQNPLRNFSDALPHLSDTLPCLCDTHRVHWFAAAGYAHFRVSKNGSATSASKTGACQD